MLQGTHTADHHLGPGRNGNGPRWSRDAQLGVLRGVLHLRERAALAVLERRYQIPSLIGLFWCGDYDGPHAALLGFTSLQFTRGLLS